MRVPWHTSDESRHDVIVAALRRPDAYSDGASSVEVIETHRAWVFLTNVHAYKLAKAAASHRHDAASNAASHVGKALWFRPLRPLQRLFFHTPLVYAFVLASALYHDHYRWPLLDRAGGSGLLVEPRQTQRLRRPPRSAQPVQVVRVLSALAQRGPRKMSGSTRSEGCERLWHACCS
jgi:hypothetical protein